MSTRDAVLAYLRAVEAMDLDATAAMFHPDAEVVQHPNKLAPSGKRYDTAALRAAGERGKASAQICSVIELKDGKIWRQEQYDCFEP